MNKYVKMAACSGARFVEKTRARGFQPLDGGIQIGDREGYVMQSFATLIDEFRDDGIGFGRFKQFDARFPDRQHGGVDFFYLHGLPKRNAQSKLVAIEMQCLLNRADRNSKMINS